MGSDVRTESSVTDQTGLWNRVGDWLLLDGDCRLVAAGIVVALVVALVALHTVGLVDFGIDSSVSRVFGSGFVAVEPAMLSGPVPLALGIVVVPLALFSTYVLRAATVAHRTVSVGPFIPPEGR